MIRAVTVEIDLDHLDHYDDAQLAALWSVAQLDPAPIGDWAAGEAVRKLSNEIVRRFLTNAGPPMHHHKVDSYHWGQLTRFAKYVPPADAVPGDEARWHEGEWVPRDLPAGDVAAGEVAPARVRVAQQAVVDGAINFIDAATTSPEDVGWRMDALRTAVEALTFPNGKPTATADERPAAGGEGARQSGAEVPEAATEDDPVERLAQEVLWRAIVLARAEGDEDDAGKLAVLRNRLRVAVLAYTVAVDPVVVQRLAGRAGDPS